MPFSLRGVVVTSLLLVALPASGASDAESLSELSALSAKNEAAEVSVTIVGSKAPDFTSFTMADPFRVVVDWAGSKLGSSLPERRFERGLIRRISTQQFDSEAEKISRVVIELARVTTYHAKADGKRITVQFDPLPDPIPEPEVVKAPAAPAVEVAAKPALPEGPLTEPAVPVPAAPPPMPKVEVAKVETPPPPKVVAPAPAPAPAVPAPAPKALAQGPAPQPAPQVKPAPVEPVKVAAVATVPPPAPAVPTPAPKVEAKPVVAQAEPVRAAPPKAELAPAPRPAPEPVVVAEKKPEPPRAEVKSEPVRLASFPGVQPDKKPILEKPAPAAVPPLTTPPVAKPDRELAPPTARLASHVPASTGQSAPQLAPPTLAPPSLPVVKLAQAEGGVKPKAALPVDPDEPIREEARPPARTPAAGGEGGEGVPADPNDFDPGPRVMRYIGFKQTGDGSRVFVRLDGKAKFKDKQEGSTMVLELANTSVNVKNNERALDTSYFNSPVTKVQAVRSGEVTRIEVKLRESVPYKILRIGTTIAIDFKRAG